MFPDTKSLSQYTCAQILCMDFNWVAFYPMHHKADAYLALEQSIFDYGVFNTLIPDNALELVGMEFKQKAQKFGCSIKQVEAYTPNQNKAEATIRELKRRYRRAMHKSHAPAILWDHYLQLIVEIRRHTALNLFSLEGGTPHTVLTGGTPDVSHLVEFEWYQFVWCLNPGQEGHRLGRWLGTSHSVGQAMCSNVLTAMGKVIHHSSV